MADLSQTVERWASSSGTAQARYTEGVQNTQVDVVQRAIAAEGALVTGFTQAVSSGLWRRRLAAVGTQGWKTLTLAKANNYSTGIAAGRPKYEASMSVWLPRIQAAASQVNNMPGGTFSERMARAQAYATLLHNQKLSS